MLIVRDGHLGLKVYQIVKMANMTVLYQNRSLGHSSPKTAYPGWLSTEDGYIKSAEYRLEMDTGWKEEKEKSKKIMEC